LTTEHIFWYPKKDISNRQGGTVINFSNLEKSSRYLLQNVHQVPVDLFTVALTVSQYKQKPIHILKRPMRPSIEGLTVEDPHGYSEYFIIINSNHIRVRQRTTLAHEIAEIHLEQLKTGTILNQLMQPNKKNESRAFALAKLLLVPSWFLRDTKELYGDDPAMMVKFISDHCHVSLNVACLRVNNAYPEYGYTLTFGKDTLFSYGVSDSMRQESLLEMGKYMLCGWC